MTVIINGTTGITSVNGSAAAPSVTGTDTDTGIVYGTNTISFATGGATAGTFDASGNLGVGTTSPSTKVHINGSGGQYFRSFSTTNSVDLYVGSQSNDATIYVNSNHPLTFSTNGTERARFNAGAPILCLSGGNTSATGTGIAFPATQSASTDANTLDDYEEGLWTPAFTSSGASFTYPRGQYGSYVKIGSLVYAQFYIGADATGTTSNANQITGFPFASANLNALAQASATAWISQTQAIGFTMDNNSTLVTMWKQNNGSPATATAAQTTGGYVVGTIIYRAST